MDVTSGAVILQLRSDRIAGFPGDRFSMHVTETRVRYADTDPTGVVHHANYLVYFEER
jgi:hypothetical protein